MEREGEREEREMERDGERGREREDREERERREREEIERETWQGFFYMTSIIRIFLCLSNSQFYNTVMHFICVCCRSGQYMLVSS